jgi:hypothetical protein
MNEAKILACPFCGKPATVKQAGKTNYWWVGCEIHLGPESSGCGVSHSDYDREEAIRKWNIRAGGRQPAMSQTAETKHVGISDLLAISERLKTQDNRITQNPMFCVQVKVRDVGYDSDFSSGACWYRNAEGGDPEIVYDKKPKGEDWEEYGYKDRWETVMVAFTEGGCEEYLRLNGHNDRSRAHNGEVRIYVESFNRCPEMIAIREALMANASS